MAFRSYSVASSSTNISTIDPGKPAGTVSTDILLASINANYGGGTRPIVPPIGWTLLQDYPAGTAGGTAETVFWALGSVTSTAFAVSGGSAPLAATIGAWSGRNNTPPITASAGTAGAGSAPSVTAAANDDIAVFWYDFGAFGAAPSPLVEQLGTSQTNNGFWSLATQDNVTAGATGVFTRSAYVGITVALAAASGGGGPSSYYLSDIIEM